MSGWWFGDSGPRAMYGSLGTSGRSLGERLAAGLGGGVRPEWHTDVWPLARPRLRGWDNSLITGPCQPEGTTAAKCFLAHCLHSTACTHKHITACDAYCILIDILHIFPVPFCHNLSLNLFDNWHKWPQLTNTNASLHCEHKIRSIPFIVSGTKQQAVDCISSLYSYCTQGRMTKSYLSPCLG